MGYSLEDAILEQLIAEYHEQRQTLLQDISRRKPAVPLLRTLQREEKQLRLPRASLLLCQAQNKQRLLQLARSSKNDYISQLVTDYYCDTEVTAQA